MFIPSSCDIGFLWSHMRIEANDALYNLELKNHGFETLVEIHDGKSQVDNNVEKSGSVNENIHTWPV